MEPWQPSLPPDAQYYFNTVGGESITTATVQESHPVKVMKAHDFQGRSVDIINPFPPVHDQSDREPILVGGTVGRNEMVIAEHSTTSVPKLYPIVGMRFMQANLGVSASTSSPLQLDLPDMSKLIKRKVFDISLSGRKEGGASAPPLPKVKTSDSCKPPKKEIDIEKPEGKKGKRVCALSSSKYWVKEYEVKAEPEGGHRVDKSLHDVPAEKKKTTEKKIWAPVPGHHTKMPISAECAQCTQDRRKNKDRVIQGLGAFSEQYKSRKQKKTYIFTPDKMLTAPVGAHGTKEFIEFESVPIEQGRKLYTGAVKAECYVKYQVAEKLGVYAGRQKTHWQKSSRGFITLAEQRWRSLAQKLLDAQEEKEQEVNQKREDSQVQEEDTLTQA